MEVYEACRPFLLRECKLILDNKSKEHYSARRCCIYLLRILLGSTSDPLKLQWELERSVVSIVILRSAQAGQLWEFWSFFCLIGPREGEVSGLSCGC